MRVPRLLFLFVTLAAGTALALSATPGADVEQNRLLLKDWRLNNPDEYARLRHNYLRWQALPRSQQERIRQLDSELHSDPATRERLGRVLEEYTAWLARLSAGERERILSAPTRETKLRVIGELKEREWFQRLPHAYQQQYAAAKNDADRQTLLQKWRQQERDFEEQWNETHLFGGGLPNKRPMFPFAPQAFWKELFDYLRLLYPMLEPNERTRLEKVVQDFERGNNPGSTNALLRTVLELSERHPLLSLKPNYASFKGLPSEYQRALAKSPKADLANLENRWPQYPLAVTTHLRSAKAQPAGQLGPSSAREISDGVERWVQKELWPKLTGFERSRLRNAEGKWPDYPQTLHEAAKAHRLAIPELGLPGDPRIWEFVRQRPMLPPGGRKGP